MLYFLQCFFIDFAIFCIHFYIYVVWFLILFTCSYIISQLWVPVFAWIIRCTTDRIFIKSLKFHIGFRRCSIDFFNFSLFFCKFSTMFHLLLCFSLMFLIRSMFVFASSIYFRKFSTDCYPILYIFLMFLCFFCILYLLFETCSFSSLSLSAPLRGWKLKSFMKL